MKKVFFRMFIKDNYLNIHAVALYITLALSISAIVLMCAFTPLLNS